MQSNLYHVLLNNFSFKGQYGQLLNGGNVTTALPGLSKTRFLSVWSTAITMMAISRSLRIVDLVPWIIS